MNRTDFHASVLQAFHKDDKLCAITGTSDSAKAYTSLQYGIDKHLELDSDLAYGELQILAPHGGRDLTKGIIV
jgi:hypothetical protein